jgi:hypothetical protein
VVLKKLLLMAIPVAVLGCATVKDDRYTQAGMSCWREIPTGSSLPVTRCVTEEERRKQKEGVDAAADDIHRSPSSKSRPGGA